MTISNFDMLFYSCIFLLPGFIVKKVIDTLVPPPNNSDAKNFFLYLFYSIVHISAWSWLYCLILSCFKTNLILNWIILFIITIAGAIIIALFLAFIIQKDILNTYAKKLGLKKIHNIPTAWDYFFSKQEEAWVIIQLKSGKIIYGLYSSLSFSSSVSNERDIYIEKIYNINENNEWIEDANNKGILITKESIETIEFI